MAESELQRSDGVFAGIRFAIISNGELDKESSLKLTKTLENNGAERVPSNKYGRLDDVKLCTHIISTTSDFPEYDAAANSLVPVVKPTWVYHSFQNQKQSNTKGFNPDPKLFFSDVVVTCADIPEGDKDAIVGGVLAMGGTYSQFLTSVVTHIVALTQDNSKCRAAENKHLSCKVVLPHWFDDCLKLGKKIDERPYMLPDPAILNMGHSEPMFEHRENRDAFLPSSRTSSEGLPLGVLPPSSPSPIRQALNVFNGQSVKLSQDLDIARRLRGILEELIRSGGGFISESVSQTDIYVCQYRDGSDYFHASRAEKVVVGSLLWLYHMINYNAWTDPMRRLLHYPIPRDGMDCFKGLRISISNYTGDARSYLQRLVEASGAEFTRAMSQRNTHLITAHTFSEKCEAAREWNVNVVNHLWLEESYAKCQAQSLANPRYSHFPKSINLGEVVGQTAIDREMLRRNYWGRGLEGSPRKAKAKANPAVLSYRPSPQKNKLVVTDSERTVQGSSSGELVDDVNGGLESTPLADKEKQARTPATHRRPSGKENETPPTTGSRGAKDRAVSKMHDLAPDIALYEKEMKRKGGVIHGGRRASHTEDAKKEKEADKGKKRSHDESEEDGDDEEEIASRTSDRGQEKTKRFKHQLPSIDHRMLLTGANEYIEDDKKETNLKARLRNMGILLTNNPVEASILCAPKVMRTRKFVGALASAPLVVSTTFLDYCLKHDSPPPTAPHALGNDRDTKERFGFHISQAISRAKMNGRRLLRGWTIFCTEAIKGGFDTYKEIVYLNGGQCLLWKGRASVTVMKREPLPDAGDESQNQGGEAEGDVLYLISGTSEAEVNLWPKFRALAEKHDMRPRIVKPDWLLVCAMAQQVEWRDDFELPE